MRCVNKTKYVTDLKSLKRLFLFGIGNSTTKLISYLKKEEKKTGIRNFNEISNYTFILIMIFRNPNP